MSLYVVGSRCHYFYTATASSVFLETIFHGDWRTAGRPQGNPAQARYLERQSRLGSELAYANIYTPMFYDDSAGGSLKDWRKPLAPGPLKGWSGPLEPGYAGSVPVIVAVVLNARRVQDRLVPPRARAEGFLLGPYLVERRRFVEAAALHDVGDFQGVSDVLERVLVEDDQVGQLARLDRPHVLIHADISGRF